MPPLQAPTKFSYLYLRYRYQKCYSSTENNNRPFDLKFYLQIILHLEMRFSKKLYQMDNMLRSWGQIMPKMTPKIGHFSVILKNDQPIVVLYHRVLRHLEDITHIYWMTQNLEKVNITKNSMTSKTFCPQTQNFLKISKISKIRNFTRTSSIRYKRGVIR